MEDKLLKSPCKDGMAHVALLAVNHFGSSESSEKILGTRSQHFIAHKGRQKDVNNIKSCLKLLRKAGENEAGENIPCLCLHKLLPFKSFDVSCLLGKIKHRLIEHLSSPCPGECRKGARSPGSGYRVHRQEPPTQRGIATQLD